MLLLFLQRPPPIAALPDVHNAPRPPRPRLRPAVPDIYLGRKDDGNLVYAGKVERGFADQSAKALMKRAEPLLVH
jgi:hypothetical protein